MSILADAAREQAREGNGKFGTQPLAEAPDIDLFGSGSYEPASADSLDDTFLSVLPDNIEPVDMRSGTWQVDNATTRDEARPAGVRRIVLGLGGFPEVRSRNKAAAAIYADLAGDDTINRLYDLAEKSQKATVLTVSASGQVTAEEGTLMPGIGDRGLALLPKGARSRPQILDPDQVIDVAPGYGHQHSLAEAWHRRKAQFTPDVEAITDFDDVPVFEGYDTGSEPPSEISAVYMVEQPNFDGGRSPGCLFLATDVQKGDDPNGDDIVNGYFWAPRGSGLESEHGSAYGADLKRRGGKVTGYQPGSMTFGDCWKDMPSSMSEGFRRVMGRSVVDD